MSLWSEISSQAQVLGRLVEDHARYRPAIDWLGRQSFDHVMIAARGTSDNAARYAQYLWGARKGWLVSLAAPSLYGVYRRPPRLAGALVVGISQSGESPDLLSVLEEAKRQGRPTLSLTNQPNSPMAALADCHVDLGAGPEEAVAATKSYTSQLFALLALSGDRDASFDLLAPAVAAVLASPQAGEVASQAVKEAKRCVVLGRGFHHATAHEWALKVAELAYLVAQPFSAADFRHGPLAMLEPGLPVLAVATAGPAYGDVADLLGVAREEGAPVVAISDVPDCPADFVIPLPPGLPDWLAPIPAIVAAQIFTYHLTLQRGHDPDRPRGLHKVTRTV